MTVRNLGSALGKMPMLERFGGRYQFRLFHGSMDPNAFALPGGYIYVTEGLARRFQRRDDALLFVLGHEIAHVELGHCADAYRMRSVFKKLGMEPLGNAAQVLRLLSQLHFSEIQELESDLVAVRLVHAHGGNPRGSLEAMDILGMGETADAGTKRDPGQIMAEGFSDYFRTHPGSWERRNQLKQEVERLER
ncbi:MAG: M48 family metalloprotease [Elusimicrobia bacterium]|nr:M48 family metalloprotease [Elusimicrobiota bacterium]